MSAIATTAAVAAIDDEYLFLHGGADVEKQKQDSRQQLQNAQAHLASEDGEQADVEWDDWKRERKRSEGGAVHPCEETTRCDPELTGHLA